MARRGPKPIPVNLPGPLLDQYQCGALTLAELARRVGVSQTTAFRELKRRGIDTSSRNRTRRRLGDLIEQVVPLYRQGLSLRQVAKRTGLSPEGVRQLLQRAKVRRRPARKRYPLRDPQGRPVVLQRLAARLRALRQATGLSQAELAARSGLHCLTVGRLEAGRQQPKGETLARLAPVLGVGLEALGVQAPPPS